MNNTKKQEIREIEGNIKLKDKLRKNGFEFNFFTKLWFRRHKGEEI